MAHRQRLVSDADFTEAMERESRIRVFKDDHIISQGGFISRFTDTMVVVQTGVGDVAYLDRSECEFFELRR